MSVIRRPGLFGRRTYHRLTGVTAAASAATVETLTVGLWFAVVVIEPRTTLAALLGLCALFCGSILRASVVEVTTATLEGLFQPERIGVALLASAGWLCWLFVAESVGGEFGLAVAGIALAALLAVQSRLEARVFGPTGRRIGPAGFALPATLTAVGATVLLASTWFTEWSVTTDPLSLGLATVVVRVEAFQVGFVVFGLFVFLAQQFRFRRLLER
ncbi:hypothetical protein [Natrononativus amylolyticus]|uniref:hypothetical protein n=1 Tax=Natrononativus amylolyticus TaxID=2963434 RepID=UPI0020CEA9DC|nr:hypothetical protein [Natrononativus amylolyticus]